MKARIKRKLRALLDRGSRRRTLGCLATLYGTLTQRSWMRITYRDRFWHIRRRGGTVVSRDPAWWKPDPAESTPVAADHWFEVYEPRKGDTIVTIGAGRGEEILCFADAVGTSGRVIAVEAHPESYAHLERFCEVNGLDHVTPVHAAVLDREAVVRITDDAHVANTILSEAGSIDVPGMTLDTLLHRLGVDHVDFVKMNIEGAERWGILGMEDALASHPVLCIACHDFIAERDGAASMRTKSFVIRFVEDRGYEVISRDDDPRLYVRDQVNARYPNRQLVDANAPLIGESVAL